MAILEAMAEGTAVIASRVGGSAHCLDDPQQLVDPGDIGQLAAALDRLLGDPELCAAKGRANRERYESLFSPATIVARYEGLYGSGNDQ
jgi:glycosyltransferase involved in cell wall biosynthesis